MKEYVIIGNGTAAVGTIEGIRSIDSTTPITVVSKEDHPVYSRPLISYYLEGKTDLDRMQYREPDFYEKNGCRVLYGVSAETIDPSRQAVLLSDQTELAYKKLCIAAGSSPFVPPMEGLDSVQKKYSFMTLDDALLLEKHTDADSRVLIIGAGLIGLKCAEGLFSRAKSITVCDLADRVLSSILDASCASIVQKHLESQGIRFLLCDSVARFEAGTAFFKSGKTVPFDVLVLAVGVRANTALAKKAGLETGRGIIVNEKMETSQSGIYSAGDCAKGYDMTSGQNRVIAVLPNAYRMGFTAGVNMAGGDRSHLDGMPLNSIGLFGLHVMTAGSYLGEASEERDEHSVKRFYTQDGLLKGLILIGHTERAGIYTSLIRQKTPLDSVNFEAMKKIASTSYFSSETRRKAFGGVV